MSYDEDPFDERLNKMPAVIAGFAVGGAILCGAIAALVLGASIGLARGARAIIGLIACAGFFVGLGVGVVVDTLVFKPLREQKRKRRRRRDQD
jgi:hypothetical protein